MSKLIVLLVIGMFMVASVTCIVLGHIYCGHPAEYKANQ